MPPRVNKTRKHAEQVEKMAGVGMRDEDICLVIGIGESTLKRHYRKNLKVGRAKANTVIANKAFEMARDGDRSMVQFWLTRRLGWKEPPQDHQVTGVDGGAVKFEVELVKL